ncbi:zinc finger protein [Holotrichia oblita]|uniref:Zinc finger protein n=1 Tax=Holotrichia oblita TaxID=644536 RepID=A0ACB9TIL3_HOLOL|nr:zinc finger protein [Holotrichia oblita]
MHAQYQPIIKIICIKGSISNIKKITVILALNNKTLTMTDIFELICRTCLKPNKQLHNIFTHSTNNNLISDLIMDCTPMRVAVNDGFPTNACDDCIGKLNSFNDFKTMVTESDVKLHQLYKNNVFETHDGCDDNRTEISSAIKPELNELESVNGNCDINESKPVLSDPLDVNNINDNESASNNCTIESEEVITKEEPSIQPELNLEVAGDAGYLNDDEGAEEPGKNTKFKSSKNVNEKQVELLNNEDYNKIMAMGLTKKQKQNMTVFCPDCNKTFKFRYFVDVHAHVHTGNLLFKCEKCDRRFPKRTVLTQHMKSHIETKDFQCEECSRAFKTIHLLRAHKQTHVNERPFKCHLCSKAFKLNATLRNHVRVHLNEKTHVCEMCGKRFVDAGSLRTHKQNHEMTRLNKSIPCEICGKTYSNKRSAQKHITRQHNGKRPYVCDQCGRSFFDMKTLKQHSLIHTGEKPYSCRLCGKKFRQQGCVSQHMRIHTGETPHICRHCTARFKHSHHLRSHIKVHHKDQVDK